MLCRLALVGHVCSGPFAAFSKPPRPRWARSRRPRAPPGSPTRSTTSFSTLETTFSLRNMWETGLKTRCWTIFTFFSGNCPPLWLHLPMTAWIRRQALSHGQSQHYFPPNNMSTQSRPDKSLKYIIITNIIINPQSPLLRLYHTESFTKFIGDVLGLPKLYRLADPLVARQSLWHWHINEYIHS